MPTHDPTETPRPSRRELVAAWLVAAMVISVMLLPLAGEMVDEVRSSPDGATTVAD